MNEYFWILSTLDNYNLPPLSHREINEKESMLGITVTDKKRSIWIREQTLLWDIREGCMAWREDSRWSKNLRKWHLTNNKHSRKISNRKRKIEIAEFFGNAFQRLLQLRLSLKELRKTFFSALTASIDYFHFMPSLYLLRRIPQK